MRKILMGLIITAILFTGCKSPTGCYQTVKTKYSDDRIITIPGRHYIFIVVNDSGNVRYVETRNELDDSVSLDMEIK